MNISISIKAVKFGSKSVPRWSAKMRARDRSQKWKRDAMLKSHQRIRDVRNREFALIRAISAFEMNSGQAVARVRSEIQPRTPTPSHRYRSYTWHPTGVPSHRHMGYFGTHR